VPIDRARARCRALGDQAGHDVETPLHLAHGNPQCVRLARSLEGRTEVVDFASGTRTTTRLVIGHAQAQRTIVEVICSSFERAVVSSWHAKGRRHDDHLVFRRFSRKPIVARHLRRRSLRGEDGASRSQARLRLRCATSTRVLPRESDARFRCKHGNAFRRCGSTMFDALPALGAVSGHVTPPHLSPELELDRCMAQDPHRLAVQHCGMKRPTTVCSRPTRGAPTVRPRS